MKKIIIVQFFILLVLCSCSNERNPVTLNKHEILEVAFSHHFAHFQSNIEQKLFKKYGVKSVSFIIDGKAKNNIDSVEYLTYDKDGRIISRTTSECSTEGCLSYIIRQTFIYANNKIKQMNDYKFKDKHKSFLYYWMVNDSSELSKFDSDDYSYNDNIILIESGSLIWKFITDKNGNITYSYQYDKLTNNVVEVKYWHNNSDVIGQQKIGVTDPKFHFFDSLQVFNDNIVKLKLLISLNPDKYSTFEYIFNSKGLLTEVINYEDGKFINRIKLTYTYYKDRT